MIQWGPLEERQLTYLPNIRQPVSQSSQVPNLLGAWEFTGSFQAQHSSGSPLTDFVPAFTRSQTWFPEAASSWEGDTISATQLYNFGYNFVPKTWRLRSLAQRCRNQESGERTCRIASSTMSFLGVFFQQTSFTWCFWAEAECLESQSRSKHHQEEILWEDCYSI